MKGRPKPLYEQIKDQLRAQILKGELKADELAPSEAEIIQHYRVSSITARRCLNDLESEGYVKRIKGKGTYVRPLDLLAMHRHIGLFYHELISLSTGFISQVITGINHELRQTRLEPNLLSWAPVRRSPSPAEALVDLARLHHVDASILLSPAPVDWFRHIAQGGHPVASIGFAYDNPGITALLFDYRSIATERYQRLRELGHRRVAMFHEYFDDATPGVRFPSRQWDESSFEVRSIEIPFMYYDRVRSTVEQLVLTRDAPTLYYVYGYELALYVRQALNNCGVKIPEQASIIVTGNPPGPTRFEMEEPPSMEVGRRAVQILSEAILGKAPEHPVEEFPVLRREGHTLGPAPRPRKG